VQSEGIAEVGIDPAGGVYVRPSATSFVHIYRAAMQIGWDAHRHCLTSPTPKEPAYSDWPRWTHADWLRQIVAAAKDEYGIELRASVNTHWVGMDEPLLSELKAALGAV